MTALARRSRDPAGRAEEDGGEALRDPPSRAGELDLSPRELEIARLVARGYPNKTIAGILDISPWTVATYLRRVYAKLGVRCRAAMVRELYLRGGVRERTRL